MSGCTVKILPGKGVLSRTLPVRQLRLVVWLAYFSTVKDAATFLFTET